MYGIHHLVEIRMSVDKKKLNIVPWLQPHTELQSKFDSIISSCLENVAASAIVEWPVPSCGLEVLEPLL